VCAEIGIESNTDSSSPSMLFGGLLMYVHSPPADGWVPHGYRTHPTRKNAPDDDSLLTGSRRCHLLTPCISIGRIGRGPNRTRSSRATISSFLANGWRAAWALSSKAETSQTPIPRRNSKLSNVLRRPHTTGPRRFSAEVAAVHARAPEHRLLRSMPANTGVPVRQGARAVPGDGVMYRDES